MANPEHLAVLKKGVHFWNAWKISNFHEMPDWETLRGHLFR